ncbi:3-hydroxyacyl-CoA dehydrogenase family protein [uncultured Oscillibacter sp.]|uniref:3-hydroxyacyl-CoA dehydrogenase family protein n=1 Tax=uncultured Oscillibacter sp. TaxID=876091 RepID=UPI0025D5842C|nr:3-hydroxyacyl-CoA dehydrogenase NAD-binding domain-containing protein [uncultured Oscillibacter sp.]
MSEVDRIQNVAIVGIGTQGSMIAFRNALYGKYVTGYGRSEEAIAVCRGKIDKWLAHFVAQGRLDKAEADGVRKRIAFSTSLEDVCKNADLVVENVPEKIEVKQEVFRQLDELCPTGCFLNSNTSSLLMSDIYKDVSDRRRAMTFSVDHDDPVRNNYLEMMWNPSTSQETKKAALAHYRTLGFEPIVTEREIKGYSINRVWRAVKRECLYLWANGYTEPAEFDRGWMMEWNTNIGPFKLMDLIGLQTIYNIENSYYAASGEERDKPPAKLKEMIDAGHLGMKSGQGFYSGYDTEAGNLEAEKSWN